MTQKNFDLFSGGWAVGGVQLFCSLNLFIIKILRIFRIVGHPRDHKGEDPGYSTTFRGINAPKSWPFKYENNSQTLPKQLQNNFEKGQKMTFLAIELAKIIISGGQILTKNLHFRVRLFAFRVDNTPKSRSFKAKNNP